MIIPYLAFNGDCEEAIAKYTGVFGGSVRCLSRYTAETGGPALVGKIMHAEFTVSGTPMSGGDSTEPVAHAGDFKLMVHMDGRARAEACCDELAKDGELLQRLTPHPPPDDAGMGALVRDKYGYTWIITAPNDRKG